MKTRRSYALADRAGVLLGLLTMLTVGLLSTTSGASSEGPAAAEATPARTGGPVEGIKVHGHWTIEVRSADGSLVERREFDNALTSQGGGTLTRVLTRSASIGAWGILLSSSGGTHPCIQSASPAPCLVRESVAGGGLTSWPGVTHFTTLTVGTDPPVSTVILQGTAIVEADGIIDVVESISCTAMPPSVDPAVCNNGSVFTSQTLPSPVAVTAGQQVLITVQISFS